MIGTVGQATDSTTKGIWREFGKDDKNDQYDMSHPHPSLNRLDNVRGDYIDEIISNYQKFVQFKGMQHYLFLYINLP